MLTGALVWFAVSIAAQALPKPKKDERWYGAAYRAVNLVGANLPQALGRTDKPEK
jgi:hypothetical protein